MERFSEKKEKLVAYTCTRIKMLKKWIMSHQQLSIACSIGAVLILIVGIVINNRDEAKTADAIGIEETQQVEEILPLEIPQVPLEEDAYEEVNTFIDLYYLALAEGDIETVTAMRNYTDDTEKIRIEKKSDYIESHQNIICYTKKGPIENSYIVYVQYDVKMVGIETVAPALNTLFVYTKEDGNLEIFTDDVDENIVNYIMEVSAQDDVVDLLSRIDVSYNEAVESDESLNVLLSELNTRLKLEVGDQIAVNEVAANEEATAASEEQEPVEVEPEPTPEPVATREIVKATATVNVRSSDSIEADKLGKVSEGETMTRFENKENGWSKIDFEGEEGYIKSEFLEVVEVITEEVDESQTEEQVEAEDEVIVPQGKVIVKETVKIRERASTDSDKLGLAYVGDQFELIMEQADGWTRIKYEGGEGFIKSEFLE